MNLTEPGPAACKTLINVTSDVFRVSGAPLLALLRSVNVRLAGPEGDLILVNEQRDNEYLKIGEE